MLFVNVLFPVFSIIGAGFLYYRLRRPDLTPLAGITLNVFIPCVIFSSLMQHPVSWGAIVSIMGALFLLTPVLALAAELAGRLLGFDRQTRWAVGLSAAHGNTGNFGIPLILFALGDEASSTAVVILIGATILLSTLAVFQASAGRGSVARSLLNTLRQPMLYAVALALAFNAGGWTIPEFVFKPIDFLGQAAFPCMLFILGLQLGQTRLGQLEIKPLTAAATLRLAAAPALAFAVGALVGLEGLPLKVLILQTATPPAVIPMLFALQHDLKPHFVASSILVSTLLSLPTLTVLLYLLI